MFQIPEEATLLFSGNHIRNQGFIIGNPGIGLQFHFEPGPEDVREIVLHDSQYISHSILEQTADDILSFDVPKQNRQAIFKYGIQSAQSNKVFILKYGKSINIKLK